MYVAFVTFLTFLTFFFLVMFFCPRPYGADVSEDTFWHVLLFCTFRLKMRCWCSTRQRRDTEVSISLILSGYQAVLVAQQARKRKRKRQGNCCSSGYFSCCEEKNANMSWHSGRYESVQWAAWVVQSVSTRASGRFSCAVGAARKRKRDLTLMVK